MEQEGAMSITDELRCMLDERGIKWWEGDDERKTLWESNGLTWEYFNDENGDAWLGFLGACEQDITPEQAIAATLGSSNCTNGERTNEMCLPHFWTHDGTMHIELPKLPESISVCLPDKRDREVRSARVWQYTLGDADATETRQGVGTCHDRGNIERFICSECGCRLDLQDDDWEATMWLDDGTATVPLYCPNCGRRCVG